MVLPPPPPKPRRCLFSNLKSQIHAPSVPCVPLGPSPNSWNVDLVSSWKGSYSTWPIDPKEQIEPSRTCGSMKSQSSLYRQGKKPFASWGHTNRKLPLRNGYTRSPASRSRWPSTEVSTKSSTKHPANAYLSRHLHPRPSENPGSRASSHSDQQTLPIRSALNIETQRSRVNPKAETSQKGLTAGEKRP